MGKLIDTDTLLTALIDAYGLDPERLKDVVERIPAAQPEIIRCKDCKHKPTGTDRDSYEFPDDRCPCKCEDYWYSWNPDDDWFCANWERKNDE